MRLCHAAVFASIAWLSSGCSGAVHDGVRDYEHARYPEALEHLRSVEPRVTGWNPRDRAQYALYRGLAHLALGDRHATAQWLGEAKRVCSGDPSVFSDDERSRLAAALAHLPR
jgi:hypothetical protein